MEPANWSTATFPDKRYPTVAQAVGVAAALNHAMALRTEPFLAILHLLVPYLAQLMLQRNLQALVNMMAPEGYTEALLGFIERTAMMAGDQAALLADLGRAKEFIYYVIKTKRLS